ncbi:MAG: efflux RND transporter periplasmic adaptor subunit [bacterium]|nr:efflux RND transporter periplasmic adaptor subunit [bacterium]
MILLTKRWLPWLILLAGVGLSAAMMLGKEPAKRKESPPKKIKLVRVLQMQPVKHQVQVVALGSTIPSQELSLAARVGGQVDWISPSMVEGGYVEAGELLFKLDPADLLLTLDQAKATLAKAEFDLDNVEAQKKSALAGLKSFQEVQSQTGGNRLDISPLALYGPQLKNARASMASAQASLKQAELNLERTEIRAPFAGYFRSVTLALGQSVTANQQVAKLFAERPIRVKLALPLNELPWVDLGTQGQTGSAVVLTKQIGPDQHRWIGVVTHQVQEIDSMGRLAQLMIEVDQPLSDQGFPLPLGLQVKATLQGEVLEQVYKVPLYALHQENQAWMVGPGGGLEIRPLKILRQVENMALVREGLFPGDQLILSPIETPTEGMPLKVYQPETDKGPEPGPQLETAQAESPQAIAAPEPNPQTQVPVATTPPKVNNQSASGATP